jgi:hypothetical protein
LQPAAPFSLDAGRRNTKLGRLEGSTCFSTLNWLRFAKTLPVQELFWRGDKPQIGLTILKRAPRSLGRKVSDEFTVPLCREHHQQLHRHGNEAPWWANQQIVPIEIAREFNWVCSGIFLLPLRASVENKKAA